MDCSFLLITLQCESKAPRHLNIRTMSRCAFDNHLYFCLSSDKNTWKLSITEMHHELWSTGTYGLVEEQIIRDAVLMFPLILVLRLSDSSFYNQTVPSSGCESSLQRDTERRILNMSLTAVQWDFIYSVVVQLMFYMCRQMSFGFRLKDLPLVAVSAQAPETAMTLDDWDPTSHYVTMSLPNNCTILAFDLYKWTSLPKAFTCLLSYTCKLEWLNA